MLGLALLLLAAGAVSWNVHQAVKKYKFRSDVSRLELQLTSCYTLALNTAVDWTFHLTCKEGRLRAQTLCLHSSNPPPKPLLFDSLQASFNGEEFEELSIYFSPTGRIEPEGRIEFYQKSSPFRQEILLPDCFRIKQLIDKQGPTHPADAMPS